ncbi:delta subunit of the central stalk of mitochondrial F1F0 ATP synthase, atp16 [Boothiomyces macroporosus]|uniref:ATP synthase subunit delta, mitochondrial n=1 Tax=Boothiomyces macroporosus TaxID=261099 RepID=A0AAD5Y6M3_9FUNG|nr:delta subunit of the central stalk of mitochondrial F1F0 ATP synthase, atp16 [Boothiomyces macroporosus]
MIARRLLKIRQYATAAKQLTVNFAAPHQAFLTGAEVTQVNLTSTEGDLGILVGHIPTVLQLKPSVISFITPKGTEKYFVSGGFAAINPDSSMNINAVEACTLQELDFDAAKTALDAAQKAAKTGTDLEKASAEVEVELLEAVLAAKKA